ncbi:hypothetical protein [Gryllotalpicola koreensis]|uniref:Uncharacterized protein n=1 Tax=Gryllotalpicola koreensis TaxID=993086 RepID=A0ABP7ZVI9_9MICO
MTDLETSRARLVFDADWNIWVPVPDALPRGNYADLGQWADAVVDAATENDWTANDRVRLREALLSIATSTDENELRLINLADPLGYLYYVSVICWDSEESISVASLAGDGIDGAVRTPNVEEFESPNFVEGARGVVYQDTGGDNHDIGGTARWVLRGHGVDVVGLLNLYNFVQFERAVPVVDRLMRSIAVAGEQGSEER